MEVFQSNDSFWEIVEIDVCPIPKYIRNILMFCNFGNVLSMQKLDGNNIAEIEQMVKSQLKDFLEENDTHNFIDYFGPHYHKKPGSFAFTCGDKRMLEQLSEYVKVTVQKKGYTYFQDKNRALAALSEESIDEEELHAQLFNGVVQLLEPYGVASLFKEEMVTVATTNGQVKGLVHCVLCDIDSDTAIKMKRKDAYSQYWNGKKWCLSNFANRHLSKAHSMYKSKNETPKERQIGEENIQATHTVPPDSSSIADLTSIDESDNEVSMIEMVIEPLDIVENIELSRLKKQVKMQNVQMTNASHENEEIISECEIQLEAGIFTKIHICKIPANGNCLFGAIVHQNFKIKVNSDTYVKKVSELRAQVVAHIKTNFQRYERVLLGRFHAKTSQDRDISVSENTIAFLDKLSKDAWGGQESIQAISELLRANVVIFNEWGEVYCNYFDSAYQEILTIVFRVSDKNIKKENVSNTQRNHYDSIVKINDDVVAKCSSILLTNYSKACEMKKTCNIIDISEQ